MLYRQTGALPTSKGVDVYVMLKVPTEKVVEVAPASEQQIKSYEWAKSSR